MSMDDLFYNKIDFFCYEKEPNVVVITPEGTRLVSTNDPAVFTYVRLVIKKNKLKGYKVVTDDGESHDILSNGKVRDYPEGKLPGDLYGKILQELIQETQAMSIEEQGVFMNNIMNNIAKIKARVCPRYWQDCKYSTDNGVTWESPDDTKEEGIKVMELLPCVEFLNDDKYNDWYWCLDIDYNTGKVKDWKGGCCVETNFKVCDEGHYQIIDDKDNIVWDSDIEHKHYVPKFLELDSSWFGDYILITVNGDGTIKNWSLAKERISELLGSQAEERLENGVKP